MYQLTNVLSYQLTNVPIDQCTIPLSYQKAFNTLATDINFSELYYQNIIITNPNIHQPYSKLHIQRVIHVHVHVYLLLDHVPIKTGIVRSLICG